MLCDKTNIVPNFEWQSSRGGLEVAYSTMFTQVDALAWWIESRLGRRFIYKVESLNKKKDIDPLCKRSNGVCYGGMVYAVCSELVYTVVNKLLAILYNNFDFIESKLLLAPPTQSHHLPTKSSPLLTYL